MDAVRATGVWQDVAEMPTSLQMTLERAAGFDEVARLLTRPAARRIVAVGNGASYYVACGLWLAALMTERSPLELVAVPGGLVAAGRFCWRTGDVVLAISSSGELRDIVVAVDEAALPLPFAAVTAHPDSTIGQTAAERALVTVTSERAVTHTQSFCGALLACLAIWARVTRDRELRAAVERLPDACAHAIGEAEAWGAEALPRVSVPAAGIAFGTGPAWAGALETALLLKEIARVPCEGVETREGATTAMTALLPGQLAISLPSASDPLALESEEICRSRGAQILRLPGGAIDDPRVTPITMFASGLAASVDLALRSGHDPDNPSWADAYYATARRSDGGKAPASGSPPGHIPSSGVRD